MMHGVVHLEPLLATGYALLLVGIAAGLEWMGRSSRLRSDQYHTLGFRFRKDAGHWECPMGERLQMVEIDHELRVMHYRAPARTCNGCSMKPDCTDSDKGRTISVPMAPWMSSAIGRFHRGISLSVLTLAGLIIVIELFRHYHGIERLLLGTGLIMLSLQGLNLARALRDPHRTDQGSAATF